MSQQPIFHLLCTEEDRALILAYLKSIAGLKDQYPDHTQQIAEFYKRNHLRTELEDLKTFCWVEDKSAPIENADL